MGGGSSIQQVPLAAFAFLSGAVAIGFGFGAQNIINNFISGWIIMGERPIRIGDLIDVDGTLGRVEAIKDGCRWVPRTALTHCDPVQTKKRINAVRGTVRPPPGIVLPT